MNKIKHLVFGFYLVLFLIILLSNKIYSQDSIKNLPKIPSINIKTIEGKNFNTANINNNGKPIIISFFATWCKACVKELSAINENYSEWQEETGVKLYAISIDDARTKANVLPMVNGKGWDFDILSDENGDLKRSLNIALLPQMYILNKNNEIVWQHNSYTEGDENEIIKVLRTIK
ncbi:MAG: TlpA family protein disulfide reductase [Bacteroidales bacterium]|nr:TlpA family protein disulfide reductase [Bacteroidales bacterium]